MFRKQFGHPSFCFQKRTLLITKENRTSVQWTECFHIVFNTLMKLMNLKTCGESGKIALKFCRDKVNTLHYL